MLRSLALILGFAVGAVVAATSCGPVPCSPTTCPTGCCAASGRCEPGGASWACGAGGNVCAVCTATQGCSAGVCRENGASGFGGGAGAGTSTGGGTMGTGGGAAGGTSAGGTAGGGSAGGGSAGGGSAGGGSAGGGTAGGGSAGGGSAGGGVAGGAAADAGIWFGLGGELHLNTYEPGEQKQPRVATAGDGRFVAIWMSEGQVDAGTSELFGQLYSPAGVKSGPEFQISSTRASTTFYGATSYDVAMARDGRFVIAWAGYGSADRRVYARTYDGAGTPAGPAFVVDNTTDQWTEYKVSVAMRDDGSFLVLFDWELNLTAGLKARAYSASGAPLGPAYWVTNLRRAYDIDLAVARAGSAAGTYVAVYRYYDINTEIFGRRLTASGPLSPEFPVNTTTQGAQHNPSVDVRDDGSFVVVWDSDHSGQGPSRGVFGRMFDATGAALGSEFALSTATGGSMRKPGVAVTANGGFFVAWSGDNLPAPAEWEEVWGRFFGASGAPLGSTFRVNTFTAYRQDDARVAGAGVGPVVVGWMDTRQEILRAGGDMTLKYGVYGQRLSPP